MTPEAQRIAIAKACGWRNVRMTKNRPFWADDEGQTMYNALGGSPPGEALTYVAELPDYLNDLNAMHEVENNLSPLFRSIYCDWLMYGQANPNPRPETFGRWQTINATAAQRAEVFLRAIGEWKD